METEDEEMQKRTHGLRQRDITIERIFIITNFVVEIPSAVFDQLSATHKPKYALISMIMSLITMLISITDLVWLGKRERVRCMIRGLKPWFYSPYPHYKPLGTFSDIVGLVCSVFQFVFASAVYVLSCKNVDNPIQISFWPIVFALAVLYSRFPWKLVQKTSVPARHKEIVRHEESHETLSLIAEEAKRRAEIARFRETSTLTGHVESIVRLKGLDIVPLQRTYSV